ncbi:GatB/YqeY domain-containing protein [Bacillus wiedmannii]|uniref:GatB/YqeY domain-containing protein n=1 Tax=Bacillus wiedmannii TaxID=1890302 RepID=UPI003D195E5D
MIKTIKEDMKQAMRDKNKVKLSTLRMLIASTEKERIASKVEELSSEAVITCINREIKAIGQEIDGLVLAGRDTSAQEEQKAILMEYLPKQLTKEEIAEKVREVTATAPNMGLAMKQLSAELKGKADMSLVSKLVKEAFSK